MQGTAERRRFGIRGIGILGVLRELSRDSVSSFIDRSLCGSVSFKFRTLTTDRSLWNSGTPRLGGTAGPHEGLLASLLFASRKHGINEMTSKVHSPEQRCKDDRSLFHRWNLREPKFRVDPESRGSCKHRSLRFIRPSSRDQVPESNRELRRFERSHISPGKRVSPTHDRTHFGILNTGSLGYTRHCPREGTAATFRTFGTLGQRGAGRGRDYAKWDALMNFLIKSRPRRATGRYYYLRHRSIRRAAVLQEDLQINAKTFLRRTRFGGYVCPDRRLFRLPPVPSVPSHSDTRPGSLNRASMIPRCRGLLCGSGIENIVSPRHAGSPRSNERLGERK